MLIKIIFSLLERSHIRKIDKLQQKLDFRNGILIKYLKCYSHLFKPHIIIDDKSDEEVKTSIDKIRVLEKEEGRSLKFYDLTKEELLVWGSRGVIDLI